MAVLLAVGLVQPASASVDSISPKFDAACDNYYQQGLDLEVAVADAGLHCACLIEQFEPLGKAAMDFLARTYEEDLTTFIHEYPKGNEWMEASFAADRLCKAGGGATEAEPEVDGAIPYPVLAGSWGGIVRDGPGRDHARLATLKEGERITLVGPTEVEDDGYLWFRIEYRNGREGYHWGGIICSVGDQIPGTYEQCP
ncbi:MAG: SH3 domain-containing protein [Rhizobiaceae bacterium]|nr:SH3 domain-containing protein [Rhizobiaceae bacterium]